MKQKKIMAVMLAVCLLAVNVPGTAFASVHGNLKNTESLVGTASPSGAGKPEKMDPQTSDLCFIGSSRNYNGNENAASFKGPDGMGDIEVNYQAVGTGVWSDTAPVNAGMYRVRAVITENENYTAAVLTSEDWGFTISPRQLFVKGTSVKDKVYDGTDRADVIAGTLDGIVEKDNVSIGAAYGTFEDANAGTDKGVTVRYTLKGEDAGNYTVQDSTVSADIARIFYDMSGVSFDDKKVRYDGKEKYLAVSGTLPAGVTVTYEGNGKKTVGEYTVTAKFSGDSVNHEAIPDKIAKLTITSADVYTITYDLNGGRWAAGSESPTEYTEKSDFTLKAPERDGYVFSGWEGTELVRPETLVLIPLGSTGDRNYKACWTPAQTEQIGEKSCKVASRSVLAETALKTQEAAELVSSKANAADFSSGQVSEEALNRFALAYPDAGTFSFGVTVKLSAVEKSRQNASGGTRIIYDASPFMQAINTDGTVNPAVTVSNADLNGKTVKLRLAVPAETEADTAVIKHVSDTEVSETFFGSVCTTEDGEKYVEVAITHFSTFIITLEESGDDCGEEPLTEQWIPDAKGWKYRFASGTCAADGWYELANPYAGEKQEKISWFRFDTEGYMQTGWFTDRDGRKYYLNPVSDGTLGRMYHGKQTIGGRIYEFSEIHDGYYGHLKESGT